LTLKEELASEERRPTKGRVQGFLYPTTTMSARALSTIAYSSARSCAATPNLSSMPRLLRFDIEANELGISNVDNTL
jgi:hypothetical protein